ncbi:MAG: site-specific DNA-methyltransferase [Nanoarchaeota archaeon]|nr:site-specific DNA-methyltransferase [Nanoarchaeota archaeon]
MLELNKVYQGDALHKLKEVKDKSIDLVIIDPPYLIENTKAGGKSPLAKSIQGMNNQIKEHNITNGYNLDILKELLRVMKKTNIYIWCNHKQIPEYLDFFVNKHKCSFDILIWNKTNAMPLFNNKYLTDKEYCLYFRKGGFCNPNNYQDAKTIFYQPINIKDKKLWKHPTIKPLNIIETLIKNSSKENDIILDCFIGSGTTAIASIKTNRNFIGIELETEYVNIASQRIQKQKEDGIPPTSKEVGILPKII